MALELTVLVLLLNWRVFLRRFEKVLIAEDEKDAWGPWIFSGVSVVVVIIG